MKEISVRSASIGRVACPCRGVNIREKKGIWDRDPSGEEKGGAIKRMRRERESLPAVRKIRKIFFY